MRNDISRPYSPVDFEEASHWFFEIRSGAPDEAARLAFNRWLRESPVHIAAYLDVAQTWAIAGSHDVQVRFPKERLIAEALSDPDTLVAYPRSSGEPSLKRPQSRWAPIGTARLGIAAGLAGVLIAIIGVFFWRASVTYVTGIGEQRSISLRDGSTVYLGAQTQLRVHFTAKARDVYLLAGQALFKDVHEPARPFVVHVGLLSVRAVGTAFDVNRLSTQDSVAVVEGQVAITEPTRATGSGDQTASPSPKAARDLIYLSAGEQLALSRDRALNHARVFPVSADEVTAWVHGRLVFAATPLRNVVEEFNRYNRRQLVIASPSLDSFKIDGVFSSTSPTALLAYLQQIPGVTVTEYKDQLLISRP